MEPKVKLDQMRRIHENGDKVVSNFFISVFPGETKTAPYKGDPQEIEIIEDKSSV
jgi:hypothetical protein